MRQPLILICVLCTLIFATVNSSCAQTQTNPYHYSIRKTAVAAHGAVVSAHPLASNAGLTILRQGGNAFDAAITTQLALAVVYPAAGNIGGGGFMVAHTAKGRNITLDYREKAPGAATRDMYLDAAGNPRTDLSQNGHLASGVPGVIAGIFAELKYARLPLARLIQPAIDLAQNGFAITAAEARGLNSIQSPLKKYCTAASAFVKEEGWKEGDTLIQKDLAKTLRLIRDNGAKGFYEGETARLILEEMQRGKGIITAEDLKSYTAKEREPSVFPYRQYTVVTMPLPSSGGVVLQQMLKMVEDKPLASYGFGSLKAVHLMTEVERLAYADRAEYLGDVDRLIEDYARRSGLAIDPHRVRYHTAAIAILTPLQVAKELAQPTAQIDYHEYTIWNAFCILIALDCIAEMRGWSLETFMPAGEPAPSRNAVSAEALALSIVEGAVDDGFERYRLEKQARVLHYLARADGWRNAFERDFLDDAEALLGRRPGDWREADRLLEELVIADDPAQEEELLRLFTRRYLRECFLLADPEDRMNHEQLTTRMKPLDLRS